ncbi:hypothetical protein C8J57DRAFT_1249762 [Mycena rebaudengoi]|nr:hypothetical protein C8J57DRAFT_1249762 [Mycena rebaudengoi]
MAASAVHMGRGTAFSTFSSYVRHPLPNAPPTRRKRDTMPPNPDARSPADQEYLDRVSGRQLMEYRNFVFVPGYITLDVPCFIHRDIIHPQHQSASAAARYSCASACFWSFPLDVPPTFQFPTFDPRFDPALFGFTASEFNTLIPLPSDAALDELMSLWEGSGTFPQPDFDAIVFDHLPFLPRPPPESPPPMALAVEQPEPGPSAPKSRRGPRQEVDVSLILPTDSKHVRGPSELKRRMDGDEISDRVQKRAKYVCRGFPHEYGTLNARKPVCSHLSPTKDSGQTSRRSGRLISWRMKSSRPFKKLSNVGKKGLKAVAAVFEDEQKYPNALAHRKYIQQQTTDLVFIYRDPIAKTGAHRSPLMISTFSEHVRAVMENDVSYGHPVGALSLAAAALERALSLWQTGSLAEKSGAGTVKRSARSFVAVPWANRAAAYLPNIKMLALAKWINIYGLAAEVASGTTEDTDILAAGDDDDASEGQADPRSLMVLSDDDEPDGAGSGHEEP